MASELKPSGVFVHPRGLCESTDVGEGTRIWAFAHILPGARVGKDCNVCDHAYVENGAIVGDRVTLKNGVLICDGTVLEDDVFIGPMVCFTNDRFPRSKQAFELGRNIVRRGASIGGKSIILPGIEIGEGAMVGAGSVVTKDVPPHTLVVGNPARIVRRLDGAGGKKPAGPLPGVMTFDFQSVLDRRGRMTIGEPAESKLPFEPRRFFLISEVPRGAVRGHHAHRTCSELLVCVRGSCRVRLSDGETTKTFTLDKVSRGLFVPAMTWVEVRTGSRSTIVLVLASEDYRPEAYLRDFEEFRREKRRGVAIPVAPRKKAA